LRQCTNRNTLCEELSALHQFDSFVRECGCGGAVYFALTHTEIAKTQRAVELAPSIYISCVCVPVAFASSEARSIFARAALFARLCAELPRRLFLRATPEFAIFTRSLERRIFHAVTPARARGSRPREIAPPASERLSSLIYLRCCCSAQVCPFVRSKNVWALNFLSYHALSAAAADLWRSALRDLRKTFQLLTQRFLETFRIIMFAMHDLLLCIAIG
jgi:hypothetical protein